MANCRQARRDKNTEAPSVSPSLIQSRGEVGALKLGQVKGN